MNTRRKLGAAELGCIGETHAGQSGFRVWGPQGRREELRSQEYGGLLTPSLLNTEGQRVVLSQVSRHL